MKNWELWEQVPAGELVHAAGDSQRTVGNTDVSVMLKEIMLMPTRATKIRKSFDST